MAARIRETAISQLRRGVLEFCVLALLREGERYSYELVRALGDADGLVTTEGTLYPLLGRLRREGVVETTWRESPSGPPRRYYRLTPDGQIALDGFVTEWTRFRNSGRSPRTGAPRHRRAVRAAARTADHVRRGAGAAGTEFTLILMCVWERETLAGANPNTPAVPMHRG